MDSTELLEKLETMTIEEKLALLSTIDKAYIRGYMDRAAFELRPAPREPPLSTALPQNAALPD